MAGKASQGVSFVELVVGSALVLAAAGCGSDADEKSGVSPGPDAGADAAEQEASAEDSGAATPEDAAPGDSSLESGDAAVLSWQPIRDPGDPQGDCLAKDPDCAADFQQVYFAVDGGVIHFDVKHFGAFPATEGSWELMFFPKDPLIAGHTLQLIAGVLKWWTADCSSGVSSSLRHSGCHWTSGSPPAELHYEWVAEERLVMQVPLAELLPTGLSELLVGVGGAPFVVQKTAEYTDRYPDELLVTSTKVEGLQSITVPALP